MTNKSPATSPTATATATANGTSKHRSNTSVNSMKNPGVSIQTPVSPTPDEEDLSRLFRMKELDVPKLAAFLDTLRSSEKPLKDVADFLDLAAADLRVSTLNFGSKLFQINSPDWKGPMWYLPPDAIVKLTDFVNELPFQYLLDGMTVVAKELIEIQKKSISKTPQVTSSIGHQIIVQLISKLYSGLFFLDCANGKSPADQILKTFKSSFGTSPAVGHSILWICDQQTVMYGSGSKSQFVWHPAGITVWFKYIIPVISGGGGANDSVAKTVKISSLKYIELVLKGMDLVKTRRLSSPHRIEASLQSIDFSDYLLLAQLGSSDETSTAAKIDEEIVAAFKRLLVLLRKCALNSLNTAIKLNIGSKELVLLFEAYRTTSSESLRNELADTLLCAISFDFNDFPVGGGGVRKAKTNNIHTSALGNAWIENYGKYFKDTRSVLQSFDSALKSKNTAGSATTFASVALIKSGGTALKKHFASLLKSFAKINETLAIKVEKNVKGVEVSVADIKTSNATIKSVLTRFGEKKTSSSVFLVQALIAYFIYYCVVNVACNTTTLKSSTFTPSCADVDETCYASAVGTSIGCPLDYPLFQPVRKLYKDTHAVVSPVVESTLGQINTEFVGPALEKLDTHVLQPHVFPLWKQHGAPVYTSVHTHPTVRQVLDEQVPIYWQSVKDTWHSAAEFVVNDAAPVAMSYSKQAVEFVDQHVKPHVYTGVDVAGQYVAVARDTASKTLNDIHTSEQVQAIYKSEAGQSAFKLYGDYIVKPWTVYVQPQVEEGVALWTSGVATLVNTVDCFLFSEEGDAKCSAAVRLASLQKYILDIFK